MTIEPNGPDFAAAMDAVKRSDDFAAKWEGQEMIPGGPREGWTDRWGEDMLLYPDFWRDRANDFEAFIKGDIGSGDLMLLASQVGLRP